MAVLAHFNELVKETESKIVAEIQKQVKLEPNKFQTITSTIHKILLENMKDAYNLGVAD